MDAHAHLTRRSLLIKGGLVAAGALVVDAVGLPSLAHGEELPRWSDPATWGGAVPGLGSGVVLDRAVLLDVDVTVAGLTIGPSGRLVFDPAASRTLTSTRNVLVRGRLSLRPQSSSVVHALRFAQVDESAMVGGGMQPVATDVGVWVVDAGVLDLAGSPKRAWVRAAGSIPLGARHVDLLADPQGWQVGDEVAITPTGSPVPESSVDAYDYAQVVRVEGRRVTLSRATAFAHPSVDVGDGLVIGAEVLNLTRNVLVAGTPQGRTHVWLSSSARHSLSYATLQHMGPRKPDGAHTASVLGRYALHFHMAGDATRGSEVLGVVVRDAGGHAFVPHASHGIAFTSCISHNTFDDAYWYDGMPDNRTPGPDTDDTLFSHCVASRVRVDPSFRGHRLAGFVLGVGKGNRALDCVAVGVQGNSDASGFNWPEGVTSGVWDFARCVAHNNRRHGIFTWQNTGNRHVVRDFVCFHNRGAGIAHGAYLNGYRYENGYLYGNLLSAIDLHSHSYGDGGMPQRFVNLRCDGASVGGAAVRLLKHTLAPGLPSEFLGCRFQGHQGAAFEHVHDPSGGATHPERLDIVDCISTSPMLRYRDDTLAASVIRVQSSGRAYAARPRAAGGSVDPAMNAVVTAIAPFGTAPAAPTRFALATSSPWVGDRTAAPDSRAAAPASSPPQHGHDHEHCADVRFSSRRILLTATGGTAPCAAALYIDGKLVRRLTAPAGTTTRASVRPPRGTHTVGLRCDETLKTWRIRVGRRIVVL